MQRWKTWRHLAMCVLCLVGSFAAARTDRQEQSDRLRGAKRSGLRWITISTSDLESSERYFVGLGLRRTVAGEFTPESKNPLLLAARATVHYVLLDNPDSGLGGIRLVQAGGQPIRSNAKATDYGFFDIAFAVRDTRAIRHRLSSAKHNCKDVVEYDVPSLARARIRESLCQAPDLVNTVFLQRLGEEPSAELIGVLSSVRTVPDVQLSAATFERLGFRPRSDYVYDSDAVRHIVGLPPNFKLRITLLASEDGKGARILLFSFLDPFGKPVRGKDLREREIPTLSGIYLWSFEVEDLSGAVSNLQAQGAKLLSAATRLSIPPYNGARAVTLQLPDGSRVELIERAALPPSTPNE